MTKVHMGSGGGGGTYTCTPCAGVAGGRGGGAILILASTIDFGGSIKANGQMGVCGYTTLGGGGSGGSIRIEAGSITVNTLNALGAEGCDSAGNGGKGRIAVYAESFTYTNSDPAPYVPGATATPTPAFSSTPTANPTPEAEWQDSWYLYEGEQPHAVTRVERLEEEDNYDYDDNGNMTARVEDGVEWEQTYNAENRLLSLSDGENSWSFTYDGDGNRVKQIGPNGEVTLYLGGGIIEVRDAAGNAELVKYYGVAGQRVAMQDEGGMKYLLTDHLGSVSVMLDNTGAMLSQQKYMPFGAPRFEAGITETDFGYTGQLDLAETGLMDYNARFYNPELRRFTQPDSIVPRPYSSQALNRFSYAFSNPINYSDPTGHCPAPAAETGTVICVDLFIMAKTIVFGTGEGDGRDFSADSDPRQSRAFLYLYVDESNKLVAQELVVNSSCMVIGCAPVAVEYNEFFATQDPETLDISVSWKLLNGVAGTVRREAEKALAGNEAERIVGAMFYGLSQILLSEINGSLILSLDDYGKYDISKLNSDPYPSLGVYRYQNGALDKVIHELRETLLGPLIGLSPIAPNYRYPVYMSGDIRSGHYIWE